MNTILILGGTSEARELAHKLANTPQQRVIYSLAGVMSPNQAREDALSQRGVTIRRGGFGGVAGLCAFLAQEQVKGVIDATHPFAQNMAKNALMAARHMKCKWAKIWRAAWAVHPSENLQILPSIASSAAKLWSLNAAATSEAELPGQLRPPPLRRIFLALGVKGGTEWAETWHRMGAINDEARPELIIARTFDATPKPLQSAHPAITWLSAAPSTHNSENSAIRDEGSLLQDYHIDLVIARNSGGPMAEKLSAAHKFGCRIWLIERPDLAELGLNTDEQQNIFATPTQLCASQWHGLI